MNALVFMNDEPFPPRKNAEAKRLEIQRAAHDAQPLAPARAALANLPTCTESQTGLNRNILALDLATHCGWALQRRDGTISGGAENFSPRKSWVPGQRWVNFRSWLNLTLTTNDIGLIVYERVVFGQGHSSASAGDVYGGLRAIMEMCAALRNVELDSVHVGTVKKFWTGDGRAKKPDMVAEAKRRGFHPVDDNHADALAVLGWAVAKEMA
jgi:hypothetical protein